MEAEANWMAARLGKFTASEIYLLLQKGKSESFSVQAMSYIRTKIAESLTGEQADSVDNYAMRWGKDMEPQAIEAIRALHPEWEVEYFGGGLPRFVAYNGYSGASPDALTTDALVEVKCPYVTANYVPYLLASLEDNHAAWLAKHSPQYYAQVQFGMMCCQRETAYLCAYDPRMASESHRLSILTIPADKAMQAEIEIRLKDAAVIANAALKKLTPSIILATPIPGAV